jgi:hypothetical protein
LKNVISLESVHSTARSIEIVLRGGPPFLGWCWWILEADPPFWGCMLMNSRGGPLLGDVCWWILEADPLLGALCWWILEVDPLLEGCMLMNSRGGLPSSWWNLEADPPFGWWILEADPPFWERVRLALGTISMDHMVIVTQQMKLLSWTMLTLCQFRQLSYKWMLLNAFILTEAI